MTATRVSRWRQADRVGGWALGVGYWVLGVGDWGLGTGAHDPQGRSRDPAGSFDPIESNLD
jgi:hypothetical protein